MNSETNRVHSFYNQFGFTPKHSKNQLILKVHCSKCSKTNSPPRERYKTENFCIYCILSIITEVSDETIQSIEFDYDTYIPSEDLVKLRYLADLYKIWEEIRNDFVPCSTKECVLKGGQHFASMLTFAIEFKQGKNSHICNNCKKKLRETGFLGKLAANSQIYALLLKIPINSDWKNFFFLGPYQESISLFPPIPNSSYQEICSYKITAFPLYSVEIYSNTIHESILKIQTDFGKKSPDFYTTLLNTLESHLPPLRFDHLLPIGTIIEKKMNQIENYLKVNYHNLDYQEISNLAVFLSVRVLNIQKLFPLLVDDSIDEIYLDHPHNQIYVDHRDYGRCQTFISLSKRDLNAIKTFLRISTNNRLDPTNASIQCSIHNQFFHCRFSVDVFPTVQSGFALDIRKMNRKIFTIPELIQKQMLSSSIAAFLYVCVILGINITAVGETNTGKTTLINSLDLITPSHFRKIYIEESPESLNQGFMSVHQLKYQVDSVYTNSSKTQEIYRLLHRNPDLVYLGEILTQEEAHAMFHCLSAGLKGFQTIHAKDISSLINRWQHHFCINPACFNDLGVVIFLKRHLMKRYIDQIEEISFKDNQIITSSIFQFDPEYGQWSSSPPLTSLSCFRRINLSNQELQSISDQMCLYTSIFKSLSKQKTWNANKQAEYFHDLYNKIRILQECNEKINEANVNMDFGDEKWEK